MAVTDSIVHHRDPSLAPRSGSPRRIERGGIGDPVHLRVGDPGEVCPCAATFEVFLDSLSPSLPSHLFVYDFHNIVHRRLIVGCKVLVGHRIAHRIGQQEEVEEFIYDVLFFLSPVGESLIAKALTDFLVESI